MRSKDLRQLGEDVVVVAQDESFILTLATSALLSAARPATNKRLFGSGSNTANDMEDVISGAAACKDVAAIFARGTFDSGNIGVWVGPQFQSALASQINSFAFQGVDASAYPATLESYLGEAGGVSGAQSLADTVTAYVNACPDASVIVSGWSQGALVAHQGLALLTPAVQQSVAALAVFGDPAALFGLPAVPSTIPVHAECFTGTDLDPLCASLSADFTFPTSLSDITGPFSKLPTLATGASEVAAAASLVLDFPGELLAADQAFVHTLTNTSETQRLLLTPQHFMYGNNGNTGTAADFVAGLAAVAGK
ncbi:carbohydrate esterase family 5 protein [Mycena maculata]|uniref:cutinase n=1 Tax=Mycena maculata TaxID=230809 RepID=A0AAD7NXQ0_9AGAR|nr:carbohydrate esterase family 5 protein [Mycena maculata]